VEALFLFRKGQVFKYLNNESLKPDSLRRVVASLTHILATDAERSRALKIVVLN